MPAPRAVPQRRPSDARRAPMRAPVRRQRPRSSAAPLALALVVLGLAGVAAVAAWLLKGRPGGEASAPASADAAPPAPAPLEVAIATAAPAEPSAEQVAQAVAEAPLLSPDAARALLVEAGRRGQAAGHALDDGLHVASVGFADLDRAALDELGALFERSWGSRPEADQRRIQAYLRHARAGDPLTPEAVAAGRALVAESVRALPRASQARLTALFSQAVARGIAHRQQAEERGRVAALAPPPPVEAASPEPSPPPRAAASAGRATAGPSAGSGIATSSSGATGDRADERARAASESYWRSRASSARNAVAAAERRVRELEDKAAKGGLVALGPLPPACQASAPTRGVHESGTVLGPSAWERTTNVKVCDYEILRQQQAQQTQGQLESARESLKRAQQALADLEDEARRAGALPGWLR